MQIIPKYLENWIKNLSPCHKVFLNASGNVLKKGITSFAAVSVAENQQADMTVARHNLMLDNIVCVKCNVDLCFYYLIIFDHEEIY